MGWGGGEGGGGGKKKKEEGRKKHGKKTSSQAGKVTKYQQHSRKISGKLQQLTAVVIIMITIDYCRTIIIIARGSCKPVISGILLDKISIYTRKLITHTDHCSGVALPTGLSAR